MRKFLLIISFVIVLTIIFFTHTYIKAIEPLKNEKQKAIEIAKKEAGIEEVEDFQLYHGLEKVSIVKGKNKKREQIIVWIPENKQEFLIRKASNGVTANEAIEKVKKLARPEKIIDVRLGMEKGIPLWEIYYLSDSNLINYYYVDFETGEWLKKIENL